ncbi:NAD(P)/FAD-dependent oxidoreductase [Tepidamorphus sp. 3E244]|uniref:NAD(P)/FAD-dependent oxidoreductase n=1 Tax=Tepidamorphus sp. 3E244 TaxID=3385498 RepID=UPI0038FCB390
MRHVDTIIVGGGPAGSSCAAELVRAGHDVLVLDKAQFPRLKLCAGWITQKVFADLDFTPEDYPHAINRLDIKTHVRGVPFAFNGIPTVGDNWSIRRVEFDAWLLERSGAEVVEHQVKSVARDAATGRYVIDDAFSSDHIVGAGGTMCPVRKALFSDERMKSRQIATLEKEFSYPQRADTCHLYFLIRGLEGYAWYVPKADGCVNIGIGGKSRWFRNTGEKIHDHWRAFLGDLVKQGLLDQETADSLKEGGHPYFLYTHDGAVKEGDAYIIGDAAGLATVDLGEGLGPAIESGQFAARDILGQGEYSKAPLTKYSFGGITQALARRTLGKYHTRGKA